MSTLLPIHANTATAPSVGPVRSGLLQRRAIIGRKRREFLAQRGVTKGVIECTVRIPEKGTKTVRLDVEFAP